MTPIEKACVIYATKNKSSRNITKVLSLLLQGHSLHDAVQLLNGKLSVRSIANIKSKYKAELKEALQ